MSRRESRVSMNIRQNDALFEFETFKKKFLLANKHITKLNSTLSVRIEELNMQISSLYVENLRLRASEIALASELKREREKSRKIIADAEAATHNLTKHLGCLRQTFNISMTSPPTAPPSPRARRPRSNPNPSPNSPLHSRLSRPPDVPGIHEQDEPCPSSSDHEHDGPPSPTRRKTKSKSRLSASKLPLPSRVSSPPLITSVATSLPGELELSLSMPRKPARRQSGLLSVNTSSLSVTRPASPAFGSPIRRETDLAEEEEEIAAVNEELQGEPDMDVDMEFAMKKVERRSKGQGRDAESEKEASDHVRSRERKRTRGDDDTEGSKRKLKDVTNFRTALLPIDNTVHDQVDGEVSPSATTIFPDRISPTPSPPTPRMSSSPVQSTTTGVGEESAATGGRERRSRKSVNYAEPKLNTKMRKPDLPSGSIPKKRSSAAAVMSTYKPSDDNGNDADNDTDARSSSEFPPRVDGSYINPELLLLPVSRPSSAASQFSPISAGRTNTSSTSLVTTSVKRNKSRPQLPPEDESDGAQADAEYGGGSCTTSSWVNIEGRRRAVQGTNSGKRSVFTVKDGRLMHELDERRHSMAV